MKLSSLIEKDFLMIGCDVESREQAIQASIDNLYEKKKLKPDKATVLFEIHARDNLGGTVFPTGLAMPHARIKNYNDLSIMICVPKKPVRIDDVDVKCFIIMLTSSVVSNIYLQVLATFTKLSMDESFFNKMVSAESPEAFLDILSGVYVKKELHVEDIMSTEFGTIGPDNDLKQLTDMFYKNATSYLPVINSSNKFIGEVRINDLISVGIPNYAMMIGNLNFLNSFEPFEKLMIEEESIHVRDIMKKPLVSLRPDTSVVEAALEMTQGNYRQMPVVKNGDIVGILNIMDILMKVLRR